MKAFEIVWAGLPKCVGIYAAPSAGKAKYECALGVVDSGYSSTVGTVFTGLFCKRRPEFDEWAKQCTTITCQSPEFVKDWLHKSTLAK